MKNRSKSRELVEREDEFFRTLARTGSLFQAEQAAGYSRGYSDRKKKQPGFKERLQKELDAINAVKVVEESVEIVTSREILEEATYLAMSDVTEVMECRSMEDVKALPVRVRKAIKNIKILQVESIRPDGGKEIKTALDIQMHDKIKPLGLLSMHAGIGELIGGGLKNKPFSGLTIITGKKDGEDG